MENTLTRSSLIKTLSLLSNKMWKQNLCQCCVQLNPTFVETKLGDLNFNTVCDTECDETFSMKLKCFDYVTKNTVILKVHRVRFSIVRILGVKKFERVCGKLIRSNSSKITGRKPSSKINVLIVFDIYRYFPAIFYLILVHILVQICCFLKIGSSNYSITRSSGGIIVTDDPVSITSSFLFFFRLFVSRLYNVFVYFQSSLLLDGSYSRPPCS